METPESLVNNIVNNDLFHSRSQPG